MAINDNSVVTPSRGYIFRAAVGTAAPTPAEIKAYKPGDDITGWTNIGHTSRDDLPEFGYDGGDSDTKGSWQNEALKKVTTKPLVESVTFKTLQVDSVTLEMYYGTKNGSTTAGVYEVTNAPTGGVEYALLIIVVDGARNVAFHATRTDISRDDSIEMDVEEFMAFPLIATILKATGKPLLSWISQDTGITSTPAT